MGNPFNIVMLIGVGLGIGLDCLTLHLAIIRNKKGRGSSGIPVVPWLAYLFLVGANPFLPASLAAATLLSLTVFHLVCQWIGPRAHRSLLNGRGPVHRAVYFGKTGAVNRLLEAGCDSNARDNRGVTPLHLATEEGRLDLMGSLISHGADINLSDLNECTPLHKAAVKNCPEAAALLVSLGADVNARNAYGATPLAIASRRAPAVAKLLMEHGGQM